MITIEEVTVVEEQEEEDGNQGITTTHRTKNTEGSQWRSIDYTQKKSSADKNNNCATIAEKQDILPKNVAVQRTNITQALQDKVEITETLHTKEVEEEDEAEDVASKDTTTEVANRKRQQYAQLNQTTITKKS